MTIRVTLRSSCECNTVAALTPTGAGEGGHRTIKLNAKTNVKGLILAQSER